MTLDEQVSRFIANEPKLDRLVNGAPGDMIPTPAGQLPSFAGLINILKAQLNTDAVLAAANSVYDALAEVRILPNGNNDDVQVQAAVDQLAVQGGGTIVFGTGGFQFRKAVLIGSSLIRFAGQGQNRTSVHLADNVRNHIGYAGDNSNLFEFTGSRDTRLRGCGITGMELDGNRANNSNGTQPGGQLAPLAIVDRYWTAIRAKFCDDGVWDDVFIHHCAANGFQFEDASGHSFGPAMRSSFNGFNGGFAVNETRNNRWIGGAYDDNDDIGLSFEAIPYALPNGQPDPDRHEPEDGDGASDNTVIGGSFCRNGGAGGWSPRMVDADYGIGGLQAKRLTILGVTANDNKGRGCELGVQTGEHIVAFNQFLRNRDTDLNNQSLQSFVWGNRQGTSYGTPNRAFSYTPGQSVASWQHLDPAGYVGHEFYNDLNQLVASISHGNSGTNEVVRNAFNINALAKLILSIADTPLMAFAAGKVTMGGRFGIGTDNPTSALQVVGLPIFLDNDAAKAGGLTAGALYFPSNPPFPGALAAVF